MIQSPLFITEASSITMCLMTGSVEFVNPVRILINPTKTNGLDQPSLIQVDKIVTVDADHIRNRIGSLTPAQLAAVDSALKLWLGLS